MKAIFRYSVLASLGVLAAAANAQTFTNVQINSAPLTSGSSFSTSGNSISVFTPNAIVGDAWALTGGTVNVQYDYNTGAGAALAVTFNSVHPVLGSGTVFFTELVFALDNAGNEIGGPIGTGSGLVTASSSSILAGTINLGANSGFIRVKKSFTLSAPPTAALDMASIAVINQAVQVVPEPATMAALGLGAAALIRRRRSK